MDLKQIYVSRETAEELSKLPKGTRIVVVDTILNKIVKEVLQRARISDLSKDNFEEFFEKMLEEMCDEKDKK